jgi:hypothetical protein
MSFLSDPDPTFREWRKSCEFRVKDPDLVVDLKLPVSPDIRDDMIHFCIKRKAWGFMDEDGENTAVGFRLPGDPCMEGCCPDFARATRKPMFLTAMGRVPCKRTKLSFG